MYVVQKADSTEYRFRLSFYIQFDGTKSQHFTYEYGYFTVKNYYMPAQPAELSHSIKYSITETSVQTASFITRVLLKTHGASNYGALRSRLHQSVVFQYINKLANGMKLATDQTLLLVQFGFRRPWETAVVSCKHEPFKTLENILKTKISIKLKQYITSQVEKIRNNLL